MQYLKVSVFCLLLVVVHAEEKKNEFELPDSEDKITSAEKRWIDNNQAYQPTYTQKRYQSVESEGKGQERAKDEKTFKDFLGYDAIQSILLSALKPKPIVDTAEQSEKDSPNDGSAAQFLGNLIVRGTETISRAVNNVIDGPKLIISRLSSGATEALNQLGAYLVGL